LVAWVWLQDRRAGKLFLAAVVIGSIFVAVGMALAGFFGGQVIQPQGEQARMIICFILIGFAFKLAVVPFSFWLAPLCERSSTMTSVLVISLLDMAEFGELAFLRVEAPWIFSAVPWIWIALALLSMFGGALLALAQTNLRRMLAYSSIDDIGYLVLGLATGSVGGVLGALIGALSHSLCKFLLFGALGMAEDDLKHPITLSDRGLAGRQPVAGAAFIAGALGMIGVPPFLGFLGRWRLYFGGIEGGGVALVLAMAVATVLALFYYVRAIHRVWLGQATENSEPASKRFIWIEIMVIGLISLLIVAGLFPAIMPGSGGR
jgi:NADH:ubiquinone oxidoreductase subunit 2 (subunit N)